MKKFIRRWTVVAGMAALWSISGSAAESPNQAAEDAGKKKPTASSLDDQLFEDLTPAKKRQPETKKPPTKEAAGEDLGEKSKEAREITVISRQMREIEALLRARDTSAQTRTLQERVVEQLSRRIEDVERNQSQANQQNKSSKPGPNEDSGQSSTGDPQGTGKGNSDAKPMSPDEADRWGEKVWGVLPDRIRQRIQNMGNEEFLPEYEHIIRRYYEELSKRPTRVP